MKYIYIAVLLIIINFSFLQEAYAQIGLPPQPAGRGMPINTAKNGAISDLGLLVNNSLIILFTVGGIGLVIMIVWGAVNWILSGGDKEKIASARKRITTAIVGLVLLSLTFVILYVLGQVLNLQSLYSGKFEIKGLLEN